MFVWVGKEADDVIVIGRVVLAEMRLYWLTCSVPAEFVARMIRIVFGIEIVYY